MISQKSLCRFLGIQLMVSYMLEFRETGRPFWLMTMFYFPSRYYS